MSKRTGIKVQENRTDDDFIMLPTVDFCFKELMRNEKVRKGIIAALLGVRPEEIKETRLLPTILRKEYEDDKYGILDVRVEMHDGTQIDFEMQVAEFDFWKKRIVFYLSKMVTDQIHKGDDYDKIQKCIHVSILDFVHFPEDNIIRSSRHAGNRPDGKCLCYRNRLLLDHGRKPERPGNTAVDI